MPILETPKVIVNDQSGVANNSGTGGEIPIFISPTGNAQPNANILKFTNYNDCTNTVQDGGIGEETNNYLLPVLKDFFEESLKINSDDIGVPYLYVKDLGTATPSSAAPWVNAIPQLTAKRDAQVEAYIFKRSEVVSENVLDVAKIKAILTSIEDHLKAETKRGRPKIAYFTVLDCSDAELKSLTHKTNGLRKSRIALIEPDMFGKLLARICVTPYYEEPGFYEFRTVSPEEFTERSENDEELLQQAGIIFAHDEKPGKNTYPKINLAVSTAFAVDSEPEADQRPKDALLHARRNVDQLIRDAVETAYPQLKRNETEVFLQMLQADLDALVNNKIRDGIMLDGTRIIAVESEADPFKLLIDGAAKPVNATELIEFTITIE